MLHSPVLQLLWSSGYRMAESSQGEPHGAVFRDIGVGGEKKEVLLHALPDEQPVKGILVGSHLFETIRTCQLLGGWRKEGEPCLPCPGDQLLRVDSRELQLPRPYLTAISRWTQRPLLFPLNETGITSCSTPVPLSLMSAATRASSSRRTSLSRATERSLSARPKRR